MTRRSTPFARVRELELSPWRLLRGEDLVDVPEALEDWDASADLHFSREVEIPHDVLISQTGLCAGSFVRICSGWFCELSRTRRIASELELELNPGARVRGRFVCPVPGRSVARTIQLETRIVLISRAAQSLAVSARLPGSLLFQDAIEVKLEGVGSRFPMEWVDFETTIYPDSAPWALVWDRENLEAAALGAIRLYLNAGSALITKELGPTGSTNPFLEDALELDLVRSLIEGALENPEFMANPKAYESESVGGMLRNLIRRTFGESPRAVRELRRTNPSAFDADLKAGSRVFGASP